MTSLSKSVIGSSAEERELQICRLGWSLLLLWLIMIIYMTKVSSSTDNDCYDNRLFCRRFGLEKRQLDWKKKGSFDEGNARYTVTNS
ncbi:unnamed protein product [Caenorhabditis nigoni]